LVFTALNFDLLRRNSKQADKWQHRTYKLTEQGQVTDRYTRAIEQLGSDKRLEVRIGAIYALERITIDSPRDHPTIMEVLIAFIREHSHEQWPDPESEDAPVPERTTRPDLQAALNVVGRRDPSRDIRQIDLSGANLSGAKLGRANLAGADLRRTILAAADLKGALLNEREDFTRADLDGRADLRLAHLEGAHLQDAHLERARLNSTHLERARLRGAHFDDATLIGAHSTGAHIDGARFADAKLMHADFTHLFDSHADMTGANLNHALWPGYLNPPEGWRQTDTYGTGDQQSSRRLKRDDTQSGSREAHARRLRPPI